jgi:DNA polymerase phi
MNQLSHEDRYLHRAAQKAVKALQVRVQKESQLCPVVIKGLTTGSGTPNFDKLTKTKVIEGLLIEAKDDIALETLKVYEKALLKPTNEEDQASADTRRQQLADQLLSVVRSGKSEKTVLWYQAVLKIFAQLGFFNHIKKHGPRSPVSTASQSMFRTRLSSCLAHLMSVKLEADDAWPYVALDIIRTLEQEPKKYAFAIELDETVTEARDGALKILDRIHKKKLSQREKKSKAAHLGAFELLYSLVILQLYNGEGDALALLDELKLCYDKVVRHKDKSEEDIDASEVLVEIILSFVSKPSVLLRKIAEQAFAAFSAEMTAGSLQLLLNVLETKESVAGQQELFDQEGSDDEEEDSTSDDEDNVIDIDDMEIDSDVELLSANGLEESDNDDSAEDSEEETGEDDMNEEDALKFDAALAKALGTHRDADGDDAMSDSSDSDADMDDEAMEKLDSAIAKVFKERKKITTKKQNTKDAKETIINFKNRVLELLEVFLKQQHASPLALPLIQPILTLIRTSKTKPVADKAAGVLNVYFQACKGKDLPTPTDTQETWQLLRDIHSEAMKESSTAHSNVCSQASLLLVKVLVGLDRGNVEGIIQIYGVTWAKWLLEKKCNVQPSLFSQFVNWSTSASKQLAE